MFVFEQHSETTVSTMAKIPHKVNAAVGTEITSLKETKTTSTQTKSIELGFSFKYLRNKEEWSSWTGISSELFDVLLQFFCLNCTLQAL